MISFLTEHFLNKNWRRCVHPNPVHKSPSNIFWNYDQFQCYLKKYLRSRRHLSLRFSRVHGLIPVETCLMRSGPEHNAHQKSWKGNLCRFYINNQPLWSPETFLSRSNSLFGSVFFPYLVVSTTLLFLELKGGKVSLPGNWKVWSKRWPLFKPFLKSPWQLSSGLLIIFQITLILIIKSKDISMRVVGWILINISLRNIFWKLLLLERNHQNSQAVLGATGMNGLNAVQVNGDIFGLNLAFCIWSKNIWYVDRIHQRKHFSVFSVAATHPHGRWCHLLVGC